MSSLLEQLTEILLSDERLKSQEGQLLKNITQELARKNDPALIKLLLSDQRIKDHFFVDIEGTLIFDKEKFTRFITSKQFLPDSYTAFKNKIGLAVGNDYISEKKDVVLAWPYKDCVLEGGMTKEDQKRDEIFFNSVLAPDQITRLLDPKAFTSISKIDNQGKSDLVTFTKDSNNDIKDNLIINGNNLYVLSSLLSRFAGKINLIYIDPPYNTGNDGFSYNDSFNHASWLTFMKNRLELARNLLCQNGSIYIQLDNNEVHYAKVLMDEIFGRENFQREIIWHLSGAAGYKSLVNNYVRGHDTILFYTKSREIIFNKQYLPYSKEQLKRFSSVDENGRKYKSITKDKKLYLDEAKGIPISDVWSDIASFQTIVNSPEITGFSTQKPETLIKRVIEISSNENDIILDFTGGSGTTASICHKLNRQYILVEQITSQIEIILDRMAKVIKGDNTPLSRELGWNGGGEFVYLELAEWNQIWIDKVELAIRSDELIQIWEEMNEKAFLSYKVEPKSINENASDFKDLSIEDQKKFLIECLDKNHLYINYSEIEDQDYGLTEEEIRLNREFYS